MGIFLIKKCFKILKCEFDKFIFAFCQFVITKVFLNVINVHTDGLFKSNFYIKITAFFSIYIPIRSLISIPLLISIDKNLKLDNILGLPAKRILEIVGSPICHEPKVTILALTLSSAYVFILQTRLHKFCLLINNWHWYTFLKCPAKYKILLMETNEKVIINRLLCNEDKLLSIRYKYNIDETGKKRKFINSFKENRLKLNNLKTKLEYFCYDDPTTNGLSYKQAIYELFLVSIFLTLVLVSYYIYIIQEQHNLSTNRWVCSNMSIEFPFVGFIVIWPATIIGSLFVLPVKNCWFAIGRIKNYLNKCIEVMASASIAYVNIDKHINEVDHMLLVLYIKLMILEHQMHPLMQSISEVCTRLAVFVGCVVMVIISFSVTNLYPQRRLVEIVYLLMLTFPLVFMHAIFNKRYQNFLGNGLHKLQAHIVIFNETIISRHSEGKISFANYDYGINSTSSNVDDRKEFKFHEDYEIQRQSVINPLISCKWRRKIAGFEMDIKKYSIKVSGTSINFLLLRRVSLGVQIFKLKFVSRKRY